MPFVLSNQGGPLWSENFCLLLCWSLVCFLLSHWILFLVHPLIFFYWSLDFFLLIHWIFLCTALLLPDLGCPWFYFFSLVFGCPWFRPPLISATLDPWLWLPWISVLPLISKRVSLLNFVLPGPTTITGSLHPMPLLVESAQQTYKKLLHFLPRPSEHN